MPKKYSSGQRKAYYSGMGYAVRGNKRSINFTSNDMKDSFMAGYQAGRKKVQGSPTKYPKNPNLK